MARGWESKAVADQIEEEENRRKGAQSTLERSPETVLLRQRLETLKLSRARTLIQLEAASRPAYRQVLEKALSALEEQIEEVTRQVSNSDTEPST